jgi:hypothetical protein
MKRTVHEQSLFEFAVGLPVDVLADAAIDQANRGKLTEAAAVDISEKFAHAASVARERRYTTNADFNDEVFAR